MDDEPNSFSCVDEETIIEGIGRLASAIKKITET
jgi:hypothetical protein